MRRESGSASANYLLCWRRHRSRLYSRWKLFSEKKTKMDGRVCSVAHRNSSFGAFRHRIRIRPQILSHHFITSMFSASRNKLPTRYRSTMHYGKDGASTSTTTRRRSIHFICLMRGQKTKIPGRRKFLKVAAGYCERVQACCHKLGDCKCEGYKEVSTRRGIKSVNYSGGG